jgi:hypothetical protein
MFDEIFTPGDGDSETGTPLTPVQNLQIAVSLMTFGHAMTDFILRDEARLQEFFAMLNVTEENADFMRAGLDLAHDTFVNMCARAQSDLLMAKIIEMAQQSGI